MRKVWNISGIKKRISIKKACIVLCGLVFFAGIAGYSHMSRADEISDKTISSAQKKKADLEKKKYALQNDLADLTNDSDDIMKYIEKLDKKMNKVANNIKGVNEDIKAKKAEIKSANADISQVSQTIQVQYDVMKKRIKYMYENGDAEYIEILMNSKSITDLLNRSEYIQKISEYDKNMLVNYMNTKNLLETRKAQLEDAKQVLEVNKEELDMQKKGLKKMESSKTKELKKYQQQIDSKQDSIDNYDDELEKQEQIIIDALLQEQKRIAAAEKKKAEEEAKKAEEAKKDEEAAENTGEPGEEDPQASPAKTKKPKSTKAPATATPDKSTAVSPSGFRWPLPVAGKITSPFGKRTSPTAGASTYHQGIDIGVAEGTSIMAAKGGEVVTASYSAAAGNYVMINHGNGIFTVYMHASALNCKVGDKVEQGQVIAYVGSTGVSTGSHLHFGLSSGGMYVNPLLYV